MYKAPKLGILGGGQLGRMLIQAGIDLDLQPVVMDPAPNAPCRSYAAEFVKGDLTDHSDVFQFGKNLDLVTIEIENVNPEALQALQNFGVKVYPQPEIVSVIQDKRVQKQFYKDHDIPTSEFVLIDNKEELHKHSDMFPAFQKLGKAGYDGRGVYKISSAEDISTALEGPSLLEKAVPYEKEISVIVARNTRGEVSTFPVVEMVFHPEKNVVEYLFSPADIDQEAEKKARDLARKVINDFGMVGLLAVEMFYLPSGEILVNEVAPRPHNSGHQTIKGNYTSQYEQHLRCILGLPLGATDIMKPSALVNLLGEDGYEGEAAYEGVEDVLAKEGIYIHLYGKKQTRPFRKMGHAIIIDSDRDSLREKVYFIKDKLKIKA